MVSDLAEPDYQLGLRKALTKKIMTKNLRIRSLLPAWSKEKLEVQLINLILLPIFFR